MRLDGMASEIRGYEEILAACLNLGTLFRIKRRSDWAFLPDSTAAPKV
jgi:hypothetical protein